MTTTTAAAPARRGRRCDVCSLAPQLRLAVETALADGTSLSRIARSSPSAPSRDSLRRHVQQGHLPVQLQDRAARAQGLDLTTLVSRVSDIAQRARSTALEAVESSNHAAAVRAGDAELRALTALVGLGVDDERQAALLAMRGAVARAAYTVAQSTPEVAELIAIQLDRDGHHDLADELRPPFSETKEVTS